MLQYGAFLRHLDHAWVHNYSI